MFLAYLLFSCFSFNLNLPRRSKKIAFNGKTRIDQRSLESSWYFVKLNFYKDDSPSFIKKIINEFKEQDIFLKSSNCISKNVYNLFLTPSQVNFILSNNYGEIHELQSDIKLINSPDDDWTILTVESSNSNDLITDYSTKFSNDKCKFKFYFSTESMLSISGQKQCLNSLAQILIQDKRVYSVAYSKKAEVLNTRTSGFAQKNTYEATSVISDIDGSHIIDVDRFLNKQGLDGTGVTILVADTYLDTNSTFFYDPQCPNIEYNKIITNHRKISYISAVGDETVSDAEHGTHTAGTVAGRALNDSSTISKYNGCAYGSKLAYYTSNSQEFNVDLIVKTVDIVKPHISSNSWGLDRDKVSHDKMWDEAALAHSDTLFIFAAGNSGASQKQEQQGFQTLRSPGSAKNILTVGAVEAVSIDEDALGPNSHDIYLLDSSGPFRYLKPFEWSVKDISKNTGLKKLFNDAKIKIKFTRDPSEVKNTSVLVIDNIEQFYSLSRENPPYYVVSTFEFEIDNFSELGFSRTFPVMYLANESIPQYTNDFIANYRTNKTYYKADFSSQGTGNQGMMKPDIMCPGVNVVSAKSIVNGTADHKELTAKFGTSMATPVCAGAAALVYQYFLEGKYREMPLNLSSQLSRSFMINCADPLTSIHPNAVNGYGMVNLGKYIGNGIETDNSRILISDHNKISEDHLMATVSLTKSSDVEFRITLSYLDSTYSADSSAALVADIDLVVVSPSGTVYRGNQREDNCEEHYSTNERVIVKPDEIEEGDYEIHVLTSIPSAHQELREIIEFAVTIFGPLGTNSAEQKVLKFEKATKCIPLAGSYDGECNDETTMNECNSLRFGRSCQLGAFEYAPDIPREVYKVPPYGVSYVALLYPWDNYESITYRVTPASIFEPKIAAFYNTDTAGMEADADEISTSGSYVLTMNYDPDVMSEYAAVLMITNLSPYPVDFVVEVDNTEKPSDPTRPVPPTSEPTSEPTSAPTSAPTSVPTSAPTSVPTSEPTSVPTSAPTSAPTTAPSVAPSSQPSSNPPNERSDVVSKSSFLIVSGIAIAFGLIMIALIVFILVMLLKKNQNGIDIKSGSSMAAMSQSLL